MEPADVSFDSLAPADAIVLLVAAIENTDPTALPILHDTIDPDALDRILESGDSLRISFEYAGHDIMASPDGIAVDGERYQ